MCSRDDSVAARRLETKNFFKIAAAASDFGGPLEEQWFCARLQTMNKGLVVNSEPLARVWSPLLAIVLLVLLFPTRSLKMIVYISLSAATGVALSRSDWRARMSGS